MEGTSLAPHVFALRAYLCVFVWCADHYSLLEFRSIIAAVRLLIEQKGMKLLDAFRAFDFDRDGMLSCSELYGGLEWLGMSLTPDDIYAIVR